MMGATLEKRFIVDHMVGKIARWLRVLGFDARYERVTCTGQLDAYGREGFLVITRTRRWSGRPHVIMPLSNDPMEQLREIIDRVPILYSEIMLLHRCLLCNRLLELLPRDCAFGHVPDYVFETNVEFCRCPGCGKIFWRGSHPRHMTERLQRLVGWDL